jgi:large subunit ribosomal protein L6
MSRVGKKPITLPAKVEMKLDGQNVKVKGPKGELAFVVPGEIAVAVESGTVTVTRPNDERQVRALHGLTRALLNNMVTGVSQGFRKTLLIEGVGYRAEMKGKDMIMYLGYSHPITLNPPDGITYSVGERGVIVHIDGIDRQLVGETAAYIRSLRPPEPYHGKGVRYEKEVIRRKAGKAGKAK